MHSQSRRRSSLSPSSIRKMLLAATALLGATTTASAEPTITEHPFSLSVFENSSGSNIDDYFTLPLDIEFGSLVSAKATITFESMQTQTTTPRDSVIQPWDPGYTEYFTQLTTTLGTVEGGGIPGPTIFEDTNRAFSFRGQNTNFLTSDPVEIDLLQLSSSHSTSPTSLQLGLSTFFRGGDGFHFSSGSRASAMGRVTLELEHAPPEHIIVLTHGWRGNLGDDSGQSYMTALIPDIEERLNKDLGPGQYAVMAPTWANSGGVYEFSRANTDEGGIAVADSLISRIEAYEAQHTGASTYEPTIHLIGHSLGTMVNAYAAQSLHSRGVSVDLITMLDIPKKPSAEISSEIGVEGYWKRDLAGFDDAFFYWSTIPRGSTPYVENYYADTNETVQPTFGQPIAGTVPCSGGGCSGLEVPNSDHSSIWQEYYTNRVAARSDEPWVTPALDNVSIYNTGTTWNPEPRLAELVNYYNSNLSNETARAIRYSSLPGFATNAVVNKWQRALGTVTFEGDTATVSANSPSAFSAIVNFDSLMGIEFRYDLLDAVDGELSVYVGQDILWSLQVNDTVAADAIVYVSTIDLFGPGEITFQYYSPTDGETVAFSDFAILTAVAVPEPATLATAAIMIGCIVINRHKS